MFPRSPEDFRALNLILKSDESFPARSDTALDSTNFLVAYQRANKAKYPFICVWDDIDPINIREDITRDKPTQCGLKIDSQKIWTYQDGEISFQEFFVKYGGEYARLVPENLMEHTENDLFLEEKIERYFDTTKEEMLTFPQLMEIPSTQLPKIDTEIVQKIQNHIEQYHKSTKIDWKNRLSSPPKISRKNKHVCPSLCKIISLEHGTSLQRAHNIQKHGFFEITRQEKSDLTRGIVGRDMRENWGGIGEQGLTFFFNKGRGNPLYHAQRVAKMDDDMPAIVEFDACVCNFLTIYDTLNPKFIKALRSITEEKSTIHDEIDRSFHVRYYAVEADTSPLNIFQRLSTSSTSIGTIMDTFGIDGMEENDAVSVMRDPNKNMLPRTLRIKTIPS